MMTEVQAVELVVVCVFMSLCMSACSFVQNMLQDSLQTFHEVSHSHFLEKTDIILFLNKKDIFLDRIKTVSLATCFPSYKGFPII